MRAAISKSTGAKVAVQGAHPSEVQEGTSFILEAEARLAANFDCVHLCDTPLEHVTGYDRPSGHVHQYWRHVPGTGLACGTAESGEGEWHRRMKKALFPTCQQEWTLPGGAARADVLVQSGKTGQTLMAVEIQHSRIDPDLVRHRMVAHRAAGLRSTWWMLSSGHFNLKGKDRRFVTRTPWVIDLLEEIRKTKFRDGTAGEHRSGYSTSAVVILELDGDIRARQVKSIEVLHDERDERYAEVEFGARLTGEQIKLWAGRAPGTRLPTDKTADYAAVNACSEARIHPWKP